MVFYGLNYLFVSQIIPRQVNSSYILKYKKQRNDGISSDF